MTLSNIRMSVKLPMSIVGLSLIVALTISWMGYRDFRNSMITKNQDLLQVVTEERAKAVSDWVANLERQVINYAADPTAAMAMQGFTSTFGLLMEDPSAELQAAYIDDNPHPIGQKDLLDRSDATIPYNFQHANFHGVYRAIKDQLGLYDLFLIDPAGTIVYSVYKERDFATNLETGPYRNSGLADAFRAARAGTTGKTYFSDFAPYAPSANSPAAFLSSPIMDKDGAIIGVMAIQLPTNQISAIASSDRGLGTTGDITLFAADLRARSSSRFDGRHQILDPVAPNDTVMSALQAGTASYDADTNLSGMPAIGHAVVADIAGAPWVVLGEIDMAEVNADALHQRNKTLLFTGIAMVGVALCGWLLSRTFSQPIAQVAQAMQRISERDYDAALPDLSRRDEIGALARGLAQVSDRLKEFDESLELEKEHAAAQRHAVEALATGLQRMAAQDFSYSLQRELAEDYEPLRRNFNETVDRLGGTITDIKRFSATLEDQTDQIGRDASELSQRTENQASTLEETAAAIDQITQSISQSSGELQNAETLIVEADNQAKQGRTVIENTTRAMGAIEKSSEEISSIIRVVDDIAFQTNLLALNAGVEAARAGDAGRGFAVVAAEVRQLAMRSTEAVSQIKTLINTSSANVQSGVTLVRDTESVLLQIIQRIDGISTMIRSVASSAAEQSSNIAEINSGVNNLDRVTQQNAMMVENSTTSLRALSGEAANLASILGAFKTREGANNVVNIDDTQFATRRAQPRHAS